MVHGGVWILGSGLEIKRRISDRVKWGKKKKFDISSGSLTSRTGIGPMMTGLKDWLTQISGAICHATTVYPHPIDAHAPTFCPFALIFTLVSLFVTLYYTLVALSFFTNQTTRNFQEGWERFCVKDTWKFHSIILIDNLDRL